VDKLFALVFILIFLDSHYWCCNGPISSCCNTWPWDLNCCVATSCIDSSQHSVLSLKFSTIMLQHPISTCCNTLSWPHCKTSWFGSTIVATPLLNLSHCNTLAQPLCCNTPSALQYLVSIHCIAILCLNSAQPPCCNTWSQPATLQYPTHHIAIHCLNVQPSCCNTILTCFTATSPCNFLKSSLGLSLPFPLLSLYLHSRGLPSVILNKYQVNPEVRDGMSMMYYWLLTQG